MSNSHYEGGGRPMPGPDRRMTDLLPSPPRMPGAGSPHDPPVWCMPDALIGTAKSAGIADKQLRSLGMKKVTKKTLGEGLERVTWVGDLQAADIAEELLGDADLKIEPGTLSVDCILVPAMMPAIGPATDPEPADPGLLAGLQEPHGNVQVAIVDTGLYEPAGRLAPRVEGKGDPDPIEKDGRIAYVGACHGGAIAGIVASRTGAKVTAYNALVPGHTFMCDSSVFAALVQAAGDGAGVINMSWGSYSTDCHFPIATNTFVENHDDILFVAAAGNDGTDHPWYPAALAGDPAIEHVVSVGAYATTGPCPQLAMFSNFGDWVNAYAPGVDVVTDYVSGLPYRYADGAERMMWGAVYWSGTSFAAPAVLAAVVAAARKNETPLQAWHRLREGAPVRLS